MSRAGLKEFSEYLDERAGVLNATEAHLCHLQEKYETFFAEISRVRESELEQLREHIVARRGRLPGEPDISTRDGQFARSGERGRRGYELTIIASRCMVPSLVLQGRLSGS